MEPITLYAYNRKVNDFLTNFFAWWPIGLTMNGYRNLHNMHHKYVGTPHDPEVIYKQLNAEQWHLPTKPLNVLKLAAKDLMGFGISDYLTILTYAKPTLASSYIPLFLCHAIFISASALSGEWGAVAIWYHLNINCLPYVFPIKIMARASRD